MAAAGAAAVIQPLRAKKEIPVALELYSLRAEAGKDLPGVLAAIKKMGYDGIELVCEKGGLVSNETLWGRPFGEVAGMIKDNGLEVYSVHHGFHLLQPDQIQKTIEINQNGREPQCHLFVDECRQEHRHLVRACQGVQRHSGDPRTNTR